MKKSNRISCFIVSTFLFIIVFYTVVNFAANPFDFSAFITRNETIRSLKDKISDFFKSDDLLIKDNFININGLYGRISGRRLYNNVLLLNNGYLTTNPVSIKDNGKTEALLDFQNYVEERGGHFIYALFPFKIDYDQKLLPSGYSTSFVKNTEQLLDGFTAAGINVVDTIPALTRTAADIEENFYKTDHHWKVTAAYKAFLMIMDRIKEIYPEENFSGDVLDINNWTVHEIPGQFLGSWGKRVGLYFAGIDPLYYMTPDFDTNLSLYIPYERRFVRGSAEDAFIQKEYLEPGGNKLRINHHSVFLGNNYPLTIIRNSESSSHKKILVIQDSFFRPMMPFLSLIFQETIVIDPRRAQTSSIKEYVDRLSPDIVMIAFSVNTINGQEYYSFSDKNDLFMGDTEKVIKSESSINIEAMDKNNNFIVYWDSFENERLYSFNFSDVITVEGTTNGAVSLALYNKSSKKNYLETIIDTDFCGERNTCEWIFETPESGSKNLELRLYAGILRKTNGTGVIYNDVTLYDVTKNP